jgi:hypothetical protein
MDLVGDRLDDRRAVGSRAIEVTRVLHEERRFARIADVDQRHSTLGIGIRLER